MRALPYAVLAIGYMLVYAAVRGTSRLVLNPWLGFHDDASNAAALSGDPYEGTGRSPAAFFPGATTAGPSRYSVGS